MSLRLYVQEFWDVHGIYIGFQKMYEMSFSGYTVARLILSITLSGNSNVLFIRMSWNYYRIFIIVRINYEYCFISIRHFTKSVFFVDKPLSVDFIIWQFRDHFLIFYCVFFSEKFMTRDAWSRLLDFFLSFSNDVVPSIA